MVITIVRFECGLVTAEMVRPDVGHGPGWGGHSDATCLRIAGLARAIQVKLKYHHIPVVSAARRFTAHIVI